MNAHILGKIEKSLIAAWSMVASDGIAPTGVSIRVADDSGLFEVVYDKNGDLTCKRLS